MTIFWDELSALKLREDSYYYSSELCGSSFATKADLCCNGVGPEEEVIPSTLSSLPCHFLATACAQISVFVAHYHLPSTVESVAASYLGKYLASLPGRLQVDGRIVLLILLTSLFLAIKMECKSTFLPVSDLLRIFQVQSVVTVEEILKMELHLLKTLQWKVNPPLPQQYVHLLFQLLPTDTYFCSSPCLKQVLEDRALALALKAYRNMKGYAAGHRHPCYRVSLEAVTVTLESVGMSYAREVLVDLARDTYHIERLPGRIYGTAVQYHWS